MIPSLFLLFPGSHTIVHKFQVCCFHPVSEKDCVLPQHPEWVSGGSLISVLPSFLSELCLSPGHLERAERDEDWLPPNGSDPQVGRVSECRCPISLSLFFPLLLRRKDYDIYAALHTVSRLTALMGVYILLLGAAELHRLNWSVPSMSLWLTLTHMDICTMCTHTPTYTLH